MTLVVLGAGPLGGAIAHRAAASAGASRIVIVDDAAEVARGKALDIRQAGPVEASGTALEGTSDLAAVVGAAAVVVADRHAAGEWTGDDALRLLAAVRRFNRDALLVCAGAAQLDTIDRFVHERDGDRRRVVGTAAEAVRSAATALAALEAGVAPRDVMLTVLGRPPAHFVPWSGASIAGAAAESRLDPPALTRLDARVAKVWPPGPLTLAAAAIRVLDLALTGAPGVATVYVVPAGSPPTRRGMALPLTVTRRGVIEAAIPHLPPRDRVRLEAALGG